MSHTSDQKLKLILRAKRIQGQVEALVRVLEEGRDCSDILQLISAARGAMNSLMAELLEDHVWRHVLNGKYKRTSQQIAAANEVIEMVKSYLKEAQFGRKSEVHVRGDFSVNPDFEEELLYGVRRPSLLRPRRR